METTLAHVVQGHSLIAQGDKLVFPLPVAHQTLYQYSQPLSSRLLRYVQYETCIVIVVSLWIAAAFVYETLRDPNLVPMQRTKCLAIPSYHATAFRSS